MRDAVVLEYDARVEWDCGNTCSFAFDRICDEVNLCNLGTDCFDCGSVVMTGSLISSYLVVDEQRVRRVYSMFVADSAGLLSYLVQCEGLLSR